MSARQSEISTEAIAGVTTFFKVLEVLDAMFLDNVKSRWLMADGTYRRRKLQKGEEPELFLYRKTQEAAVRARATTVTFEPITTPEAKASG